MAGAGYGFAQRVARGFGSGSYRVHQPWGDPVMGSGLGIPEIMDRYDVVVSSSPEKIAEAVVKVLETHYDREEMMRYVFEKFVAVM
jgi:hypothetical protein